MESASFLIGLLAWLQVKHFAADYLLQPAWILQGKGDIRHPGGYIHAAIHVVGTLPGLLLFGLDGVTVAVLALGEFLIHFTIDHLKAVHSRRHPAVAMSRGYWAVHGADQLLHHLTYTGLFAVVMR
ncbi:DUF3307 domain-containing protein [Rhizobium leguminosarum]|uniref:DUF3307 domain-containing protein n=1 Tax=Rhizobium leguminosarum TaxID=384 RepID=A0A7K3VMN4_RHILE|nr:DUF3307 domain-containing protein [Rhizobium leguminosarum]NEK18440.1 DUF3307 domain-containing protein [Rhizobium leguminosarum]NEK38695.1 DUF3307 domain-containing protein [Rhizobium leguminosarum]